MAIGILRSIHLIIGGGSQRVTTGYKVKIKIKKYAANFIEVINPCDSSSICPRSSFFMTISVISVFFISRMSLRHLNRYLESLEHKGKVIVNRSRDICRSL